MKFMRLLSSLAIVNVFTSGLTLAATLIFSFWMNAKDFGEYSYWCSVYLVLLNITQFGVIAAATVYRYQVDYSAYQCLMSRSLYVLVPWVLIFIYAMMAAADAFFLQNKLSNMLYFAPLSAYLFVNILVVLAIYRTEQNIILYSLFLTAYSLVVFLGQMVVFYIYPSYEMVIGVFLFVQLIFSIVAIFILVVRMGIGPDKALRFGLSVSDICERFHYGVPLVLSSVSMSVLSMSDRFYLKGRITDEDYGIYCTVAVACSLILFCVNNFAMAWGGYVVKRISSLGSEDIIVMFASGQRLVAPGLFLAIIIVSPVLTLIYNAFYGDIGYNFVAALIIISIAYVVYGASKFYIGYMMAYKKNNDILKATLAGGGTTLVFLHASFFQPIVGASLALLAGFLVQFVYLIFFVNIKLRREF